MRRVVLGHLAVLTALFAAPLNIAHAADMALKARPAAAAAAPLPYNWTGVYVGIQGGAGWGHAEDTDATPFDSGRFAVRGGLIGGTLGYNWQLSNVVLGLEGDDAAAWIKGSTGRNASPPQR
jgi:outer membrane immunogenic protein